MSKSLIFAIILTIFVALTLPESILAGSCPDPCNAYEEGTPECGACLAALEAEGLIKPTESTARQEIGKRIADIVTWVMGFIGAIAIGFIVYGGITYVTSAGNEKRIQQAKQIILYAVVGFVIAILAVVIINIVGKVAGGTPVNSP